MNMSLPEKPLVANIKEGVERPEEVYFFERENGEIIHVNEKAAWGLYMGRSKVVGRYPERIKIIGVGSGALFYKGLLESQVLFKSQGLEAAQNRIRLGVQEELVACRGNIKIPRNFDTQDKNRNPVNLNTFGR